MFPLTTRKIGGYRFGFPTFYGTKHTGTDYQANNSNYYLPFSGTVKTGFGKEGGYFLELTRINGDKLIARHLKSFVIKNDYHQRGELVAITGNTGLYTTTPHLHQEVMVNEKLVDPETYSWNDYPINLKITLVTNLNYWSTLPQQISDLQALFNDKLRLSVDLFRTSHTEIPFAPFDGSVTPDVDWYRKMITPLATGHGSLLLVNPKEWKTGNYSTWGSMSYGDPGRPVRMQIECTENEFDGSEFFKEKAFHEICHMIFFLTGQTDRTHEYLYTSENKKDALLELIDYEKLIDALERIKPVAKIKIRQIRWSDGQEDLDFPFDTPERQAEVISKLTTLFPDYELDLNKYNLGKRPF